MKTDQKQRIKDELIAAGVSAYGLRKFESKYLPNIIHSDEHIGGVVYGRYQQKEGTIGLSEGMLVATDQRIIFLDHKPGYTAMDEISYDVVSGVQQTNVGPFSGVNLHTRLGDFSIRFANNKVAEKFCHFIETRRFEKIETSIEKAEDPAEVVAVVEEEVEPVLNDAATEFLALHEVCVLSTIDRSGNLHGAAVYYLLYQGGLFMLTKSGTQKARNLLAHPQVAVTVYDASTAETAQMRGAIEVVTDQNLQQQVFKIMSKPRVYAGEASSPPVAKLKEGSFVVLRFLPTSAEYHNYKKAE